MCVHTRANEASSRTSNVFLDNKAPKTMDKVSFIVSQILQAVLTHRISQLRCLQKYLHAIFHSYLRCPRTIPRIGYLEERMLHLSHLGFKDSFRMLPHTFTKLMTIIDFKVGNSAQIDRDTIASSCLFFLAHRAKYRIVEDALGIGHSYAHAVLPKVLSSIIKGLKHLISFPFDIEREKQCWSAGQRFKHFEGAIGAVDGTLIKFKNPKYMEPHSWWCRKGFNATNAMVVCDSQMQIMSFSFGFEGSAHDQRVMLESGLLNKIPAGCFLLGDAGYALQAAKILSPYRNTRYHVGEVGPRRARTREELFNFRPSSRRIVVERCIGRLKGKWKILEDGIVATLPRMKLIGFACACLHNFLLLENDANYIIPAVEEQNEEMEDDGDDAEEEMQEMANAVPWASHADWRNYIANCMWDEFGAEGDAGNQSDDDD